MRNGGAAHKHIEAPQSIDGGDARRWYLVTSQARLPTPSCSSLLSTFFSLSNLFIPHNKKRGKVLILSDYIAGNERKSMDRPKKRDVDFIYFLEINSAIKVQKIGNIGSGSDLRFKDT